MAKDQSSLKPIRLSIAEIFRTGADVDKHPTEQDEILPRRKVKISPNPDMENGYILQYGDNPDEIFYATVEKEKDIRKLAKIISRAVEDKETLNSFNSLPPEKRPILSIHHQGDYGGICCPGDPGEIGISSSVGAGYMAASVFVHEFHHHKQHQEEYNAWQQSVPEQMLERRLCEATASAAENAYLYRMKEKAPLSYVFSTMTNPTGNAYAKSMKETKGNKDLSAIAAMKAYSSDMGTARFYENWYFIASLNLSSKLKKSFSKGSENKQQEVIQKTGLLRELLVSDSPLDVEEALRHHACDLISEKGIPEAVKAAKSPDMNYITSGIAHTILKDYDFLHESGTIKKDELDNINIRTSFGSFSFGQIRKSKGPAKMFMKADNKFWKNFSSLNSILSDKAAMKEKFAETKQNLQEKLGQIQDKLFSPQKKVYNSFAYKNQVAYANFSSTPYNTSGNEVMRMDFPFGAKRSEYSDKATEMFSILMADPKVRADIIDKDVDLKPSLKFDEKVDKGRAFRNNEIVINPKLSAFEMAAQFVKQMQAVKQYEKGADFANGSASDYRFEINMLRSADQMNAEKRLCDAASEAAMVEFMHNNKHMMSPADKLKALNNQPLKTYEKNLEEYKGNRVAAVSKTIESVASKGKDLIPSDYYSTVAKNLSNCIETGESYNFVTDKKGQQKVLTELFSKRIDSAQIVAVACAGLLTPEEQKYTAGHTAKKPELYQISDKAGKEIQNMVAIRNAARNAFLAVPQAKGNGRS